MKLRESGQAQLLTAAVLGVVMLMAAITALNYSHQTQTAQTLGTQRTELKNALEEGVRLIHHFYEAEFGCDPVALNRGLSARLRLDGTLSDGSPAGSCAPCLRQMNIRVNGRTYRVSVGPITPINPTLSGDRTGLSQDATVEMWTQFGSQRVTQIAALINNCNYPCGTRMTEGFLNGVDPCQVQQDISYSYSYIPNVSTYPTAGSSVSTPDAGTWNQRCLNLVRNRYLGDIKYRDPGFGAPEGVVDLRDLLILKNYLRSGDTSGSRPELLTGPERCADLNGDGLINETDLGILEKVLRGYLYWLPTIAPGL